MPGFDVSSVRQQILCSFTGLTAEPQLLPNSAKSRIIITLVLQYTICVNVLSGKFNMLLLWVSVNKPYSANESDPLFFFIFHIEPPNL